jgi:hypothetical protein
MLNVECSMLNRDCQRWVRVEFDASRAFAPMRVSTIGPCQITALRSSCSRSIVDWAFDVSKYAYHRDLVQEYVYQPELVEGCGTTFLYSWYLSVATDSTAYFDLKRVNEEPVYHSSI